MAKYSGRHMAGAKSEQREPLRDNYTYEQDREQEAGQDFEDLSSYTSVRQKHADQRELERQREPAKKNSHIGLKIAIAVVAVLLVLMGVAIFYVQGYLLKDLKINVITKNKEELGIHEELAGTTDTSIKNIALLGLDSRDGSKTGSVRSDVVMIITVDNKHGKIKMTSVLRDSNVSIRQRGDDGDYYYMDDKITHSYAYGGPELVIQTLNRNFYLNIEDYVTVNFAETAAIVDAMGGVTLELSSAEISELNLNLWSLYVEVLQQKENGEDVSRLPVITREDFFRNKDGEIDLTYSGEDDYEPGTYTLSGNQAVAYARIRHLEGGDNKRASRQQTVLSALLNQARGKSKLEYPEMIRKVLPYCTTSLEFDDIVSMIPILLTNFTIETLSVPGDQDNANGGYNSMGGWVYLYDLEQAAREINEFIYETPTEVKVDADVQRVSDIYRYGSYGNTGSEYTPDDEEDWEPPEDMPIYTLPEDSESSGESSEESSSQSEGSESSEGSSGTESSEEPSSGTESSGGEGESSSDGGGEESSQPVEESSTPEPETPPAPESSQESGGETGDGGDVIL